MLAELLLNSIEKQAKPIVGFNQKRCLRSRLNSNGCEICLAVCRKKALVLSGRKIVFTEDQCTGCLACVAECPSDAFDCGFDILSLFHALHGNDGEEPVVLSCGKTRRYANQISIPCLGLFAEPVLAALNSIASQPFYLDVDQCATCDNCHVLELLAERVQGVTEKNSGTVELKLRYSNESDFKGANLGQQRRLLLRMAKNSLIGFGREVSTAFVPADNQEGQSKEEEKGAAMISRLLQQALDLLAPEAVAQKELLLGYFYTLQTNENCNLCPSCAGMCPTGALKRRISEGEKQLSLISGKCSGCGLCVEFCKKRGLALVPGTINDPGIAMAIGTAS